VRITLETLISGSYMSGTVCLFIGVRWHVRALIILGLALLVPLATVLTAACFLALRDRFRRRR
jgi:hypothetical protein